LIAPLDARPLPRRATSTGAAFMQRHLQASSSPSAHPASEKAAAPVELDAEREGPRHPLMTTSAPLAPAPAPLAKTAEDQVNLAGPRPKTEKRFSLIASPKPKWAAINKGEEDSASDGNGGNKKRGVRSRLSRWIHKLGPSSR
jgi:hypothetical protein